MKCLAIIPARSGSKRLPGKNIKDFCGKPLIAWTINAALESKVIDRVIVSTDSQEIAEISKQYGAEVPFLRPDELAQDGTPTLPVLQHVVNDLENKENYFPECVMTLQVTSPLRTAKHIKDAFELFKKDSTADSLVSCIKVDKSQHPKEVMIEDKNGYLKKWFAEVTNQSLHLDTSSSSSSQVEKRKVYARNGAAIYITRRNNINEYILGGKMIHYPMKRMESIDIDTYDDFILAECLKRIYLNSI